MSMQSSKQLRDKRAIITEQQRAIVAKAEADNNRELLEEEMNQFNQFETDFNDLTKLIADKEKLEAFKARGSMPIIDPVGAQAPSDEDKQAKYAEVFMKFARTGMRGLSRDEVDVFAEYSRGTDPQLTAPAADGGYLIPQGFSEQLQVELALWGGMVANSYIFKTKTGAPIKWPAVDDTGVTGALLAEGSTMPINDLTFANKDLDAYTYTSGVVKVSRQLLQDSYFDLEKFLRKAFARRLGTIMNLHFTTGTGSSQPNGVTVAAGVGKVSTSNSATSRIELVDLVHSVDPAYRANASWCFNDTSLALIKKLSFGSADARPLWQVSMRDGEPDKLEGYRFFVNQDMPDFGAGNKPIAFGDFDEYVIRMSGGTTFLRLDERYADELMVGFLAYQRSDGELMASNAIKTMRNPTT